MWEIRQTESKGKGVFATQDIGSGTVIIDDKAAITVSLRGPTQEIYQAVKNLNAQDQAEFFSLDAGAATHPSKTVRIFAANFYGDGAKGRIFFSVSRINHSCTPNAKFEDTRVGASPGQQEVGATRAIKSGEEICVDYLNWLEGLPCRHRRVPTLARYAFICACECCSLPPSQLALSDARRRIIGSLDRALQGYKPDDLKWLEDPEVSLSKHYSVLPHLSQRFDPLDKALSLPQQTAYNYLLALAREAEAVNSDKVVSSYLQASSLLLDQITANEGVAVLQSVDLLRSWMEGLLQKIDGIILTAHTAQDALHGLWDTMRSTPQVHVGLKFIDTWVAVHGGRKDMPFALQTRRAGGSQKPVQLTQEECKKIMRARGQTKK